MKSIIGGTFLVLSLEIKCRLFRLILVLHLSLFLELASNRLRLPGQRKRNTGRECRYRLIVCGLKVKIKMTGLTEEAGRSRK